MDEKILKVRLDNYLVETKQVDNRSKVKNLIRQRLVLVDGKAATKPGLLITPNESEIQINQGKQYVSRSAHKLIEALDTIKKDVQGLVCGDIGASTGGFTQVLLERGAQHVHAVDVGHSQLDPSLAESSQVTSYEKINARDEMPIPLELDFLVADLSFISIEKYVLNLFKYLKKDGLALILFKPQFQVGPDNVVNGVVRNNKLVQSALVALESFLHKNKLNIKKVCPVTLKGKKGNQEIFLLISR